MPSRGAQITTNASSCELSARYSISWAPSMELAMKRAANKRESPLKFFKKHTFYLDLRIYPHLNERLTKHIRLLGGRVEDFFNHKVKYLVTDKPKRDWPAKINGLTEEQSTIAANEQQFAPANCVGVAPLKTDFTLPSGHSHVSHVHPPTLAKVGPSTSSVSQISTRKSTDVLELARQWGIKILPALDVLTFCETHVNDQLDKVEVSPATAKLIKQTTKLNEPYFKIEDNRHKYRPIYKEFHEWPEVNFDSVAPFCPFSKRKAQNALEGLACVEPIDEKKVPQESALTGSKKKLQPIKKQPPLFCEICQKDYVDLEKHLQTETHTNFVNTMENYKTLIGVINSLPKIQEEPVDDMSQSGSDDSDSEGLDDEAENVLFSSFVRKTPTTFQLNTSTSTSHFLPLRDCLVSPILADHNKTLAKLSVNRLYISDANDPDQIVSSSDESSDFSAPEEVGQMLKNISQKDQSMSSQL